MTVLKSVPLIVMSDSEVPGALFHGIKIGAVDFLKRPLDESKVRSMWQHTLHKVKNTKSKQIEFQNNDFRLFVCFRD